MRARYRRQCGEYRWLRNLGAGIFRESRVPLLLVVQEDLVGVQHITQQGEGLHVIRKQLEKEYESDE